MIGQSSAIQCMMQAFRSLSTPLHNSVCRQSRRAHVRMDMYSSMGSQCGRYS